MIDFPQRVSLRLLPPTLTAIFLLASCAAGPDYVRPALDLPAAYKEGGAWKTAEPQRVDLRPWWEAYGDSTLNALIVEADRSNQSLHQAQAQYRQARAMADATRAGFWPTVGAGVSVGRDSVRSGSSQQARSYSASLDASWEPDLWGGIRRSVEASDAATQASAGDLASAKLSIEALLAEDYMELRATDVERDLYARTTAAYQKSFDLTNSRYAAGVALRADVALAETQLAGAQAQALDLDLQRSQLEHAIAILLGKAPASFSLAPLAADQSSQMQLPMTPTSLPSELLERRPDVAAAERRVAQANAEIGVARAAYFPNVLLSASGGFTSGSLAQWFDVPSRAWSLGASLAQTLFDGGLRDARSNAAVAAFDASVAQYKQTVLTSFQEVEDNLAGLDFLSRESLVQDRAVQAAQLAERLALTQYRAGTTTYLAVVTAQTLSLTNQRNAAQLLGRRLVASVGLIKAAGGGWTAAQLVDPIASLSQDRISALAQPNLH